jgi:hypothetical protein
MTSRRILGPRERILIDEYFLSWERKEEASTLGICFSSRLWL